MLTARAKCCAHCQPLNLTARFQGLRIISFNIRAGNTKCPSLILDRQYQQRSRDASAFSRGTQKEDRGRGKEREKAPMGLLYMMSALDGGGGSPKSRQKEQNQLIYVRDKGGGGKKIRHFCRRHIWKPPRRLSLSLSPNSERDCAAFSCSDRNRMSQTFY